MANPSTIDATPSSLDPTSSPRSVFVASPYAHEVRRDHLTSPESISLFGDKETIAVPVLFGDHDVDRTLGVAVPLRCVESNGDEDDISTGDCRGSDRFDHRVQFVLAIHSVRRRNWRHGYSCIHRQERVSFDEYGVRTKP